MADGSGTPTNAVLFHHPDGVDTTRPKLMGRHAAGEGFLKGFVRHAGVEAFYAHGMSNAHFDDFVQRVQQWDTERRPCHWVPAGRMGQVSSPATLVVPGPGLGPFAWRRRLVGARGYSLVGVTHTTASEGAMDGLAALLTAPVQPWDAVVCTSNAVKDMVVRLLDGWRDFLNQRTGGNARLDVRLPVIPLGVDCDAFPDDETTRTTRARLRRGLGIGDDDVAVLFVGRLSFHAKAHPLPMYLALEEVAQRTGKRLFLIQAGWFANTGIEKQFRDGAKAFCPSVTPIFLDGREPEVRFNVWFAADIFASLSDNIQETFGLTPIEAMAAGLPVVVSDWNGYRDTVRHGIEGFAVPTWMPAPEPGTDLALAPELELAGAEARDQAYNLYCGTVSQFTAVDVGVAIEAFHALIADATLRRRLGEAGRRRARENYDWRAVIAAYQALWRELDAVRQRDAESAPWTEGAAVNPLRDDPFALFAGYPTWRVEDETRVAPVPGADARTLAARRALSMNTFAATALLDEGELAGLLDRLAAHGASTVRVLAEGLAPERHRLVPRSVGWLAKMGLVNLTAAPPPKVEPAAERVVPQAPPAGAELLKRRGLEARGRGDVALAAQCFQQALAFAPDDPEINVYLGEILAAAGTLGGALERFRHAVNMAPDNPLALSALGKALMLKNETNEAIACFRRAVDRAPDEAEPRFLLGVALRRAGAVFESVQCLRTCVERAPNRADYLYHLGLALKTQGRRAEAMETFRKGLALMPENAYLRAAEASLAIHAAAQSRSARATRGGRIGLFLTQPFHLTLLKPLFDGLAESRWPLLTGDARDLVDFDPDVVVVCDALPPAARAEIPRAKVVYLQPGFTGAAHMVPLAIAADYACVIEESARARLIAAGLPSERIWVTGAVQMDPLFRNERGPLPFALPPDRKTVMFAPTFNPHLSAAPMLGAKAAALIRGDRDDLSIVIKPHPITCDHQPQWMEWWRTLAAADPHVHLVADPTADVVPYLQAADVLISDCSSVVFQYLALDRPIVLVTNPARVHDPRGYNADALEWRWRDLGEEVEDVTHLAAAVARALADPGTRADRRAEYRRLLFGTLTDGRAVERLLAKLMELEP
jgi:glycosyltransferase involved in cell wall biosynthesis/Flp pilus assembly protein TadD